MIIHYRKPVSLFMIFLIVTLPFYIADVTALPSQNYNFPGHMITKVWIYGNDEVNGVLRATGDTINVRVEINTPNVLPSQVTFGTTEQFTNCMTQFGMSYCTYSSLHPSTSGRQPFIVKYSQDQVTGNYYIDNTAPAVISLAAIPNETGPGNITLSYEIRDYYTSTDSSGCSGIKEIKINENNVLKQTVPINSSQCVLTGTIEYNPLGTANEETNSTICLIARDNFGMDSAQRCVKALVDNEIPQIGMPYLIQSGEKVDFLQSGLQTFDIAVNSTKDDMNLITLTSAALNKQDETASCIDNVCKWMSVIKYIDNTTSSFDMQFYMEDIHGNNNTVTTALPVAKDDTAPLIVSVASTHRKGTDNYFGKDNNTITATITEEGSGITNTNVKADFTPIGGTLRTAKNCTNSGTTYYCLWDRVSTTIEGTYGIVFTAVDNVGNVAMSKTEPITVDRTSPNTESYIMSNGEPLEMLDAQGNSLGYNTSVQLSIISQGGYDFYQVGDTLSINFNITDVKSGIDETATYVNLSGITVEGIAYPTCALVSNETYGIYECVFTADQILGPKTGAQLKFNICDVAGNCITYSKSIDIRQAEEGAANFWTLKVAENMPKEIDRQTTGLVEQRMYYHLKLNQATSASSLETMHMEITDCGPQEAQSYLSGTPTLIGFVRGSTDVWMKMTLAQRSIDVDNLTFTCRASIITKHGQKISQPEIETFNVTLPLYNMPLGEISDNVQEKIDEVKNSGLVQATWIRSLDKTFKHLQQACRLLQVVGSVVEVINGISLAIHWTKWTPGAPAEKAFDITADIMQSGWATYGAKIGDYSCAVLNCQIWTMLINKFSKSGDTKTFFRKILESVIAPNSKDSFVSRFPLDMSVNEQDSLILSMVTLCIPGVIYNLEKARNIECKFIYCLQSEVPQGKPIFVCDSMRNYEWCTYVTGWWYSIIPGASFVQSVNNYIKKILMDPLSMTLAGATLVCVIPPTRNFNLVKKICRLTTTAQALATVLEYLISFKQQWTVPDDYCEKIDLSNQTATNTTSTAYQNATET